MKFPVDAIGEPLRREIAATDERATLQWLAVVLIGGAAFLVYWLSAATLAARGATTHFGADGHLYALLANGIVHERVARFHPVTVWLAVAWMGVLRPLTLWIGPAVLLKGFFALIGAVSVAAATSAFATIVPRKFAVYFGLLYAVSFGVWYFASIEESKIVTVALSSLYIAVYLRYRLSGSRLAALVLTVILLLACLNEIVSCFLLAIPALDLLARPGRGWRDWRWLALHALAAPTAFLVLEGLVNGIMVAATSDVEGRSHFAMFLYYVLKNDHGLASLHGFLANWFGFNFAAPSAEASYLGAAGFRGYFAPTMAAYLSSWTAFAAIALMALMLMAGLLPGDRGGERRLPVALVAGLAAYAALRCVFFFIFNPAEGLLFSPAVTLPHLLLLAIVFVRSPLPGKRVTLVLLVAFLAYGNGAFIFVGR